MISIKRLLSLILCLALLSSLLISCGEEENPDVEKDPVQSGENDKNEDSDGGEGEKPDGDTPKPDVDEPIDGVLTLKNELDLIDVTQRLFYPEHSLFIQKLETVKAYLSTIFADPATLRGYLQSLYRDAQGIGIYADYIGNTSLSAGEVTYGASADDYAIGGGAGYPQAADRFHAIVVDEDGLKEALQYARKGDVIVIKEDICIDMTDWIIGGEVNGFTTTSGKIKYEMVIPEGVTLMGMRGSDGKKGAIIQITSYTDIAIRLEKNARLTGLCILGPDIPANAGIPSTNHSRGILIEGDGARIDNCEIAGFYNGAVTVDDCKDVQIDHNFIHHQLGEKGIGILIKDGSASIHHNLFAQVSTAVSLQNKNAALDFTDNVTVADDTTLLFEMILAAKRLTVKNNTFLSQSELLSTPAPAEEMTVENNLFAYTNEFYTDNLCSLEEVDATVYATAGATIRNNVYNIQKPVVFTKTPDGFADQNVALTPYVPIEKKAPNADVKPVTPSVISANYYYEQTDVPYRAFYEVLSGDDASITALFKQNANTIICDVGGFTNYLDYVDAGKISIQKGGKTYGAQDDEKGKIGGGAGYYQIYTEADADFVVRTCKELEKAVKEAQKGDVIYIPEDAVIVMSDAKSATLTQITIKKAITLCSNRGYVHEDGRVSTGGVIVSPGMVQKTIFLIKAKNVRFSGLVFRGPDPSNHVSLHKHAFSQGHFVVDSPEKLAHKYYYNLKLTYCVTAYADNFEFDNCELSGFTATGVSFVSDNGEADGTASKGGQVHHSLLHHCQSNGFGYAASHSLGYTEIYNNLFNYNRHSIHATGAETSGYYAFNNVEMGNALSDNFDMHGGIDRHEDNDWAGEYCYIYNNTFLGPNNPYNLRGVCVKERSFDYNVVFNERDSYGLYLTHARYGTGDRLTNVKLGKNLWGISSGNPKVQEG